MKKYGKIGRAAGVLSLILFMVLVLLQLAVSVFPAGSCPYCLGILILPFFQEAWNLPYQPGIYL